jgi:hypothetical protein
MRTTHCRDAIRCCAFIRQCSNRRAVLSVTAVRRGREEGQASQVANVAAEGGAG